MEFDAYFPMGDKPAYHHHGTKMVVGMAYVPTQEWKDIYDVDYGFDRGTLFAELDKPWFGGLCHE